MKVRVTLVCIASLPMVWLTSCSPPSREHRPTGKDDSLSLIHQRSAVPHKVSLIEVPSSLRTSEYTPDRYAVGADDTVALQLPGAVPGQILRVAQDGQTSLAAGLLAADAPLRFTTEAGSMKAQSFDGKVVYAAVERVTAAGPWSAASPAATCCGWWENTLWRVDAAHLAAGLLRAVTPATRNWSVIDFHQPGSSEPRWRVSLTEGKNGVVAAEVAPAAERIALILADSTGAAELQARRASDGQIIWSTAMESPAAQWREGHGLLAYSQDGQRLAVLVESRQRCETCLGIEIFDAGNGTLVRRIELTEVLSPRYSRLGLSDGTVWVFEHIALRKGERSTRPARCQYLAYDLATGQPRSAPSADWRFSSCQLWGLAPHPSRRGVVALGWQDGKMIWIQADTTP